MVLFIVSTIFYKIESVVTDVVPRRLVRPTWGPYGGHAGVSWASLGRMGAVLGAILRRIWALLERMQHAMRFQKLILDDAPWKRAKQPK